jgi:hypothetical protein
MIRYLRPEQKYAILAQEDSIPSGKGGKMRHMETPCIPVEAFCAIAEADVLLEEGRL